MSEEITRFTPLVPARVTNNRRTATLCDAEAGVFVSFCNVGLILYPVCYTWLFPETELDISNPSQERSTCRVNEFQQGQVCQGEKTFNFIDF